jgi:sugar phosphate isomerase/epimerase
MFSFFLNGRDAAQSRDTVLDQMDELLRVCAAESDLLCCHENEKGIYGDTAARCLDLLTVFGSRMGCVYDPANFIQCEQDAYAAFELLRPYITYFHIKDAVREGGIVVPAGEGEAETRRMLEALAKESGMTYLSLEPHLKVFDGLAALEEDEGASLQHKYTFKTGRDAFACAVKALKDQLTLAGYAEKTEDGAKLWAPGGAM